MLRLRLREPQPTQSTVRSSERRFMPREAAKLVRNGAAAVALLHDELMPVEKWQRPRRRGHLLPQLPAEGAELSIALWPESRPCLSESPSAQIADGERAGHAVSDRRDGAVIFDHQQAEEVGGAGAVIVVAGGVDNLRP